MTAVILRKNKEQVYVSGSGIITSAEKKRANELDKKLKKDIKEMEEELIKEKVISQEGIKKDALKVWFEFGQTIGRVASEYKIIGTNDEPFFWRAIYDHVGSEIQKKPIPKKSLNWKQNHFRICYIMALRPWKEVREIGNWSIWKDILDNKKILEDNRLLDWTTKKIIKLRKKGLGHKEIRKFFYAISNRLNKIDTSVLTHKELLIKLDTIKFPYL